MHATSTGDDMSYTSERFELHAQLIEVAAKNHPCGDPDSHMDQVLLGSCAGVLREAAQGHARYEALRILNPREYAELWSRALLGERFDDMVDELMRKNNE